MLMSVLRHLAYVTRMLLVLTMLGATIALATQVSQAMEQFVQVCVNYDRFLCLHVANNYFSSLDIDECNTGSSVCDINADCLDTDGSFVCSCKTGYSGDGMSCNGNIKSK